jgi:hypothetical protein
MNVGLLLACAFTALATPQAQAPAPPEPTAAQAAHKPIVKSSTVTKTVTIEKIDQTSRMITFKDANGNVDTVQAGPAIKRFNELKVGDNVTFQYSESLVFQLQKSGAAAPTTGEAAMARGTDATPSGGVATQVTTTVTVVSVDPAVPSITVKTEDGSVVTRKIQDPKNLEGVQPGDHIVITYTQALLASVEPATPAAPK